MARILILDPYEDLRCECATLLRSVGHEVLESESARQGLHLAATQQVDIIVAELLMPDMDGLELIMRSQELPDAPKVIATTHRGAADPLLYLQIAKAFGAAGAILKPVTPQSLVALVSEIWVTLIAQRRTCARRI